MIQNKLQTYKDLLNNIEDNQDKFLWIMDFGKKSKELNESLKLKEFEVPGPGHHLQTPPVNPLLSLYSFQDLSLVVKSKPDFQSLNEQL